MKRTFALTACATCFAVAALFAQQAPSSSPSARTPSPTGTAGTEQTSPAGSSASSAKSTTVTGCIERANQASPTSSSGVAANDYVLIKPGSSPTASTSRPSGTPSATGTTGTSNQTVMYRLEEGGSANLSEHVGHKVELMGMMETAASARPGASTSSSSASASNAPGFRVESIKMLSATCSE